MKIHPDLIKIGEEMATMMECASPSAREMEHQIAFIIRTKEIYECVNEDLISKNEGASLLLAHLQTWILHWNKKDRADMNLTATDYSPIEERTEKILFP